MSALPVQLLRLLAGGGIRSTAELARRLEVTEALVGMMTEDLARRGYLEDLNASCASGCGGCSLANACHVSTAPQPALFALTPKGKQLVTPS